MERISAPEHTKKGAEFKKPVIPDVTTDPLGDWIRKVGPQRILTAAEEVDLAKKIEAGLFAEKVLEEGNKKYRIMATPEELECIAAEGRAAMEDFLLHNFKLVLKYARKHYAHRQSLEPLDLVQEGHEGLMRAVERFDYKRGWKFSTYATWWIRQSLGRGIALKDAMIRLPVDWHVKTEAYFKTRNHLENVLGRSPSDKELADEMNCTVTIVNQIKQLLKQDPISLDEAFGEEKDGTFYDIVADTADTQNSLISEGWAKKVLSTLNEEEFDMVVERFFHGGKGPDTWEMLAKRYNRTPQECMTIFQQVRVKLKEAILALDLPELRAP